MRVGDLARTTGYELEKGEQASHGAYTEVGGCSVSVEGILLTLSDMSKIRELENKTRRWERRDGVGDTPVSQGGGRKRDKCRCHTPN